MCSVYYSLNLFQALTMFCSAPICPTFKRLSQAHHWIQWQKLTTTQRDNHCCFTTTKLLYNSAMEFNPFKLKQDSRATTRLVTTQQNREKKGNHNTWTVRPWKAWREVSHCIATFYARSRETVSVYAPSAGASKDLENHESQQWAELLYIIRKQFASKSGDESCQSFV